MEERQTDDQRRSRQRRLVFGVSVLAGLLGAMVWIRTPWEAFSINDAWDLVFVPLALFGTGLDFLIAAVIIGAVVYSVGLTIVGFWELTFRDSKQERSD